MGPVPQVAQALERGLHVRLLRIHRILPFSKMMVIRPSNILTPPPGGSARG
jgi:hypothetical protein